VGLITSSIALQSAWAADTPARQSFLDRYCLQCHNEKVKTAGLSLENSGPGNPGERPEIWEKVLAKLNSGAMPPAGMPRPDTASGNAFTHAIAGDLDTAARKTPYAGRPVVRRLNRLEYTNTILDLLAIELPLADELPADGIAGGFDNIGDALSISPLLLERYLKVARRVSELAVGVSDPSPVTEIFPAPDAQAAWLGEGFPFGTRGGI